MLPAVLDEVVHPCMSCHPRALDLIILFAVISDREDWGSRLVDVVEFGVDHGDWTLGGILGLDERLADRGDTGNRWGSDEQFGR